MAASNTGRANQPMNTVGTTLLLAAMLLLTQLPGRAVGAIYDQANGPINRGVQNGSDFKVQFSASALSTPEVQLKVGNLPFGNSTGNLRLLTLAPCGLNTPHFHPRAAEQYLVLKGSVEVGMVVEDGTVKKVIVNAGEAVIVPQGAIHYIASATCDGPTEVVPIFDHPQPGTYFINGAVPKLPTDILISSFGAVPVAKPAFVTLRDCKCTKPYSGPASSFKSPVLRDSNPY